MKIGVGTIMLCLVCALGCRLAKNRADLRGSTPEATDESAKKPKENSPELQSPDMESSAVAESELDELFSAGGGTGNPADGEELFSSSAIDPTVAAENTPDGISPYNHTSPPPPYLPNAFSLCYGYCDAGYYSDWTAKFFFTFVKSTGGALVDKTIRATIYDASGVNAVWNEYFSTDFIGRIESPIIANARGLPYQVCVVDEEFRRLRRDWFQKFERLAFSPRLAPDATWR